MPETSLADSMAKDLRSALNFDGLQFPVIDTREHGDADYACEVIIDQIEAFEAALDSDHEVAVQLASFGQTVTLGVTDITCSNPSILVFRGYVGDEHATLIQHVSQLNFLLLAVKKPVPEKPARRIGFVRPSED